jgi:hypothetical protein
MVENKNAKTPADNGKPVAWITRGKLTMIRADAVMLDDTSLPLYIAPSKREWVGLTEEEIQDLSFSSEKFDASHSEWFDRWGFARAIEARLKEKNT